MDSILIIDDEKDNLDALNRLLRKEFEIVTKTSPVDALKEIQKREFAVIVSDQRMPEMTGVEFLEKAKAVSPHTTRILLTGYTDIEAVIDSINRGHVYRYIAKPWDPSDLKITLRQAAEAYRLKREIETKNRALQKSNEELKTAFDRLQVLDRAKGRFLSLISHELNTPLTVLTSFISLLSDSKKTLTEDLQKAVGSLKTASDRFSEIISEVLLMVKLEAEPDFQTQKVDLKKETSRILKDLKKSLDHKEITASFDAKEDTSLQGDPKRIPIAIRKLLEDTIRRSPQKKEIKITLEKKKDSLNLSVHSQGEPLSKEAFTGLESEKNELRHHQGLGISLAICNLIVKGHGGKISLDSGSKKGNRITLEFPL